MRAMVIALWALVAARLQAQAPVRSELLRLPEGHPLAWARAGKATSAPPVLLIHGAPGAWRDLQVLLTDSTLLSLTEVSAVDRPGYGGSGSVAVTSLAEQARRIAAALERLGRPAVVVGHSLGGPIALALATEHPRLVHALVLVAGSADPALEEIRWYQHVARWPVLRWLVPQALDVCNEEMFAQPTELVWLGERLSAVQVPVTILQGDRDGLVPPGNADYLVRMLCNAPVTLRMLAGHDHFIPFSHPQLVVEAVCPYLTPLRAQPNPN